MSDFWKEVRKAFSTYDVYEIFGVDKDDVDFDTKLSNAHHRISRSLRPNKKRARNSAQKFEGQRCMAEGWQHRILYVQAQNGVQNCQK